MGIEFWRYWGILRRWWWFVALGAALAGGSAYLISRNMTPIYQTGTTLLVMPGSAQSLDSYSSVVASQRLAQTYARLIQSTPIIQKTYERLGDLSPDRPTNGFSVSALPIRDTQLIYIQVTGTDPDLITEAADTVAQVFIDWQNAIQKARFAESKDNLVAELEDVQSNIDHLETAVATAQAPGKDADPASLAHFQDQLAQYRNERASLQRSLSNITLAEATSGATVKSPQDLKTADLHVLATIQRVRLGNKMMGVLTLDDPKSLVSEAIRTLRTNLQFSSLDNPLRSVIITSALATEGKTTIAANLAVVWAQAGKRVILIDADLRRPSIHKRFQVPNRKGLTTLLVAELGALHSHLQETGVDNLQLLTSGPIPPNPQELLGSQRMGDLLHVLEQRTDMVVIDTPPVLAVADANVLASRTDGVLLVVDAGRTRRAAVYQAVESLRNVNARLLGAVLNRVDVRGGRGYYYQSYYYHSEQGEKRWWSRRLPHWGQRPAGRRRHALSER